VRLITRNDASLAIGLIVSAMVIFQRPLHMLLNVAQGIEGAMFSISFRAHPDGGAVRLPSIPAAPRDRGRALRRRRPRARGPVRRTRAADDVQPRSPRSICRFSAEIPPSFAHERDFWLLIGSTTGGETVSPVPARSGAIDALEAMANRAVSTLTPSGLHPGRRRPGVALFSDACGRPAARRAIVMTAPRSSRTTARRSAPPPGLAIALRTVQVVGETREHTAHGLRVA
jgi:hypothetical protein